MARSLKLAVLLTVRIIIDRAIVNNYIYEIRAVVRVGRRYCGCTSRDKVILSQEWSRAALPQSSSLEFAQGRQSLPGLKGGQGRLALVYL